MLSKCNQISKVKDFYLSKLKDFSLDSIIGLPLNYKDTFNLIRSIDYLNQHNSNSQLPNNYELLKSNLEKQVNITVDNSILFNSAYYFSHSKNNITEKIVNLILDYSHLFKEDQLKLVKDIINTPSFSYLAINDSGKRKILLKKKSKPEREESLKHSFNINKDFKDLNVSYDPEMNIAVINNNDKVFTFIDTSSSTLNNLSLYKNLIDNLKPDKILIDDFEKEINQNYIKCNLNSTDLYYPSNSKHLFFALNESIANYSLNRKIPYECYDTDLLSYSKIIGSNNNKHILELYFFMHIINIIKHIDLQIQIGCLDCASFLNKKIILDNPIVHNRIDLSLFSKGKMIIDQKESKLQKNYNNFNNCMVFTDNIREEIANLLNSLSENSKIIKEDNNEINIISQSKSLLLKKIYDESSIEDAKLREFYMKEKSSFYFSFENNCGLEKYLNKLI